MREYLNTLVAVALFGGLIRMLSPEGGVQKYLRLTVALCLVCAIVQPLLGGVLDGGELSLSEWLSEAEAQETDYDEIYNQALQNGMQNQAIEIIKARIYRELPLSEETASVAAEFLSENGTVELKSVQVTLLGKGILCDPREIVSLVNTAWGCPCQVIYE